MNCLKTALHKIENVTEVTIDGDIDAITANTDI